MKRAFTISALAVALCFTACRSAIEEIDQSGILSFVASFETSKNSKANWGKDQSLVVVDSEGILSRFEMDGYVMEGDAEFTGEIGTGATVKYVAYAADAQALSYNAAEESFRMSISPNYIASEAESILLQNNVAIGVMQGSRVELKSVCGFIKISLDRNGKTVQKNGQNFSLTDIRRITLTDLDGKAFAGTVSAKWSGEEQLPLYSAIEGGKASITFNPRMITTSEGEVYYQAGNYYLPVIPQNFERVSVEIEDVDGHKVTLAERAIDVKRAAESNIGNVEWPTISLEASFLCTTADESKTHEVYSFPSENLMCPRVSNTTGQKVNGNSKQNTVVSFTHQGVDYQLFATQGYGRSTNGSVLASLMFNTYNASWSYQSDKWTVGSQEAYAWVRIPEHPGLLTKIELTIVSAGGGPVNISSEVDPITGIGKGDIAGPEYTKVSNTNTAFETLTFKAENTKEGIPYYICMGKGYSYRIQGWKFHYKIFE